MILQNSIIEVWNRERLFRGSGQKKTTESEMLSEPWLHLSAPSQVTSFSIWFQAIKGWLFVYWLFQHVWNLNATHLGARPCFSFCLLANFPPTHALHVFSHLTDGVKNEEFIFNLCSSTSSIKKKGLVYLYFPPRAWLNYGKPHHQSLYICISSTINYSFCGLWQIVCENPPDVWREEGASWFMEVPISIYLKRET